MAPVAVDEYPTDLSVYGARGMGGTARDWTSTEVVQGEGEAARRSRVVRGGSWAGPPTQCRCANRYSNEATVVLVLLGFRVVGAARRTRS